MSHSRAQTSRLRRLVWLGALTGGSLGLITQAPAAWLCDVLSASTQQRVQLLNPQGTIWHGSAQVALSDGDSPARAALPSRLQWQIGPHVNLSNPGLELALALQADCCTTAPVVVYLGPSWQGLQARITDHSSNWPTQSLTGLGAPWNTVQPDGQLQLQTRQLSWHGQWDGTSRWQGQAEFQWQHFSTQLSTLRPLGSYRAMLQGGNTATVQVDTLEGRLQLQGTGEWRQGRLHFRGEASAQPEAETALSNLLNVIGQRRGAKSIIELS